MSFFIDPATGLQFPSLPQELVPPSLIPSQVELKAALNGMILSSSGWRKIFALSGDEEDQGAEISPEDSLLSLGIGLVFGRYLIEKSKLPQPRVLIGMDSRPTGPSIAYGLILGLHHSGCSMDFASVVATPAILALVQNSGEYAGFAYISASHNPPGHNGVKLGRETGGVLPGDEAKILINRFQKLVSTGELSSEYKKAQKIGLLPLLEKVLQGSSKIQQETNQSYRAFTLAVWANSLMEDGAIEKAAFEKEIKEALQTRPLGIVGEFNGSARALSIDKEFLTSLGMSFHAYGEKAGGFDHRIVPEGESLEPCAQLLLKHWKEDRKSLLGYVPDCDGDRGNLVYIDSRQRESRIMDAQTVFALSVLAELSYLVRQGKIEYGEDGYPLKRVSVVVNGPTSMRVDEICDAFKASVYRAEVGEANVVGLAESLRRQGHIVRILGEGSNGGNISHPSKVRDPLNTLGALVKMLTLLSTKDKLGLYEIACQKLAQKPKEDFQIEDLLALIPKYITTSAYEDRALLQIRSKNHALLKSNYEDIFVRQGWPKQRDSLMEEFGIAAWEEINYEGQEERHGFGPPFRSGKEKGGLKILLKDRTGTALAYMWMRGSGTEPVFRVMVDVKGQNPFMEEFLLAWHVSMIQQADDNSQY
jgi:phosphoglucomutase